MTTPTGSPTPGWRWMRASDGGPSSRLFEFLMAFAAVVGLVVSVVSIVIAQNARTASEAVIDARTSNVTNNYYSADGAPGESDPVSSSGCGDAESEIVGGWGPDRPVFVMDHPPTYTTFNAIRNNPDFGDERGLMRVRDTTEGVESTYGYEVTVQRGHTYSVTVYVENSALDDVAALSATDSRLKVSLPTCDGHRIASNAFVTSPTSYPREIWGGVTFQADERFNLAYVSGTARLFSNAWPSPDGLPLNAEEELFTSKGIPLGYEEMDGTVRTGYQYSMYVSFDVTPQFLG